MHIACLGVLEGHTMKLQVFLFDSYFPSISSRFSSQELFIDKDSISRSHTSHTGVMVTEERLFCVLGKQKKTFISSAFCYLTSISTTRMIHAAFHRLQSSELSLPKSNWLYCI